MLPKVEGDDSPPVKFPDLANCTYLDKGFCSTNGCYLSVQMSVSVSAGNSREATEARDRMIALAKQRGCTVEVKRPRFKTTK